MATDLKNLEALSIGTGTFSFSPGAVSVADAQSKGYQDFGNIVATGLKPEIEKLEHEGSYRGKKVVDKRFAVKGSLGYTIKCDEMRRQLLKIALGGDEASVITQSAQASVAGDLLGFTAVPAVIGRWYDIFISAARIREITTLNIGKAAAQSVTVTSATDVLGLSSHGFSNGDRVVFTGTTAPTGLAFNTIYFVRDSNANDFKVAATSGGAAIDITADGSAVLVQAVLIPDTDFVSDAKLGRVRFLTAQAVNRYPIVSASAIVAGDAASLVGITPMQTLIRSGYGRLTIYDDTHTNKVVYDHADFSCQVSFEGGGDSDGKKVIEFDFEILVTDTVGTVWAAED